jgi:hypothetical protein
MTLLGSDDSSFVFCYLVQVIQFCWWDVVVRVYDVATSHLVSDQCKVVFLFVSELLPQLLHIHLHFLLNIVIRHFPCSQGCLLFDQFNNLFPRKNGILR